MNLLIGSCIYKHNIERFVDKSISEGIGLHPERRILASAKKQPSIWHQLAVQDHGREIKEAQGYCWFLNVKEIFGQGQIVNEEGEIEEVVSWGMSVRHF